MGTDLEGRGARAIACAGPAIGQAMDEMAAEEAGLAIRELAAVAQLAADAAQCLPTLPEPLRTMEVEAWRNGPPRVAFGLFGILAGLETPTPGERDLAADPGARWAKVYEHRDRTAAGATGTLSRAYVPTDAAGALALLGAGRIGREMGDLTREASIAAEHKAALHDDRKRELATLEYRTDAYLWHRDRVAMRRERREEILQGLLFVGGIGLLGMGWGGIMAIAHVPLVGDAWGMFLLLLLGTAVLFARSRL